MSANVEPFTRDSLESVQAAIVELRGDLNSALDRLRAQSLKERRIPAGTLVIMRATAGHFDRRIKSLEERVAVIEKRA